MRPPSRSVNPSTLLTAAVLGITYAVSGLHHGFFEVLQGNTPTPGIMIASIGPEHVRWEHGTDGAMTLIPNFLATGLASMAVSAAIIAWCLFGLRRRTGPAVFLLLFVLLTLVGGGIGHVVFFAATWAYATRIRSPLTRWGRVLPLSVRAPLARAWVPSLVVSAGLFLVALEASVWGYIPGASDPDRLLGIIWLTLLASLLLLNVAFIAGLARDLEEAGRLAPV